MSELRFIIQDIDGSLPSDDAWDMWRKARINAGGLPHSGEYDRLRDDLEMLDSQVRATIERVVNTVLSLGNECTAPLEGGSEVHAYPDSRFIIWSVNDRRGKSIVRGRVIRP
jgi:hypothetical protein